MRIDAHFERHSRLPVGADALMHKYGLAFRSVGIINIYEIYENRMQQSGLIQAFPFFEKADNHLISNKFAKPSDDPVAARSVASLGDDKRVKATATTKTIRLC